MRLPNTQYENASHVVKLADLPHHKMIFVKMKQICNANNLNWTLLTVLAYIVCEYFTIMTLITISSLSRSSDEPSYRRFLSPDIPVLYSNLQQCACSVGRPCGRCLCVGSQSTNLKVTENLRNAKLTVAIHVCTV